MCVCVCVCVCVCAQQWEHDASIPNQWMPEYDHTDGRSPVPGIFYYILEYFTTYFTTYSGCLSTTTLMGAALCQVIENTCYREHVL